MASLKLRFKLTSRCNNGCEYCYEKPYYYSKLSDMSFDMLQDILARIKIAKLDKEFKRVKIAFTGGDPTLWQGDVGSVVSFARKLFDNTFITMDTTSRSNTGSIDRFVTNGGKIYVSLNNSELQEIDPIITSYRNNMLMLLVVLSDYNIDRISEICQFVLHKGIRVRFNPVYSNDNEDYYSRFCVACETIKQNLSQYNYLFGCLTIDLFRYDYCGYGNNYMFFDETGLVYTCQLDRRNSFYYKEIDSRFWLQTIRSMARGGSSEKCIGISNRFLEKMHRTAYEIYLNLGGRGKKDEQKSESEETI